MHTWRSFLPITKIKLGGSSASFNLAGDYSHHGVVHIILVIAIVVLLVLGLEKIFSGVAAAEIIWAIIDIRNVASDVSDSNKLIKGAASFQIGFFLLIIGALALVGALVLISMKAKKSTSAPAQPMM